MHFSINWRTFLCFSHLLDEHEHFTSMSYWSRKCTLKGGGWRYWERGEVPFYLQYKAINPRVSTPIEKCVIFTVVKNKKIDLSLKLRIQPMPPYSETVSRLGRIAFNSKMRQSKWKGWLETKVRVQRTKTLSENSELSQGQQAYSYFSNWDIMTVA